MKCHNCGTIAHKDDKFCLHCGNALAGESVHISAVSHSSEPEVLPAEQADKLIKEAKRVVRHLSREEQVIGIATITAFFSFFFPWFENFSRSQNGFTIATINNRLYLVLLVIVASLALLYFGQGAKKPVKIFYSRIHAVIGAFIFASEFIVSGFSSYTGILLLIVSGGVMSITALYYQKKLLAMKE